MYFWGEEYFRTLKDVAAEARAVPAWVDYAAFCEEYERGLRREAFKILERFMSSFERAPFAERRRFVSWLSQRADRRDGRDNRLIPHHFYVRVVEPTLLEWTAVEPHCGEPHLWLGGYDHVKRAFELEPDQLARRKLLLLIWGRVDFEAYELGHLKNIDNDMATLSEVEELLKGLSNAEDRLRLAADLAEDRRFIKEHSRKQSGQ